jgi:hypothetical protein
VKPGALVVEDIGEGGDLRVAPDQWRELGGEIGRVRLEALQRREGGGQTGDDELPDLLLLGRVGQPVTAEREQRHSLGKLPPRHVAYGGGEKHLSAVPGGEEPGEPVQPRRVVIPVRRRLRRGEMERHPHPQRTGLRPGFGGEGALGRDGGGDGPRRFRQSGLKRIADRLEMVAAVGANRLAEDRVMALDGAPHGGPVALPEPGRALDVGEEEGDGPRGDWRGFWHGRSVLVADVVAGTPLSQDTVLWTWCCRAGASCRPRRALKHPAAPNGKPRERGWGKDCASLRLF